MKKILFATLFATGIAVSAYAQTETQPQPQTQTQTQDMQDLKESDVPAAVKTSFKSAFPNAKDVEWKMKEGKYKVSFEVNGTDHMAAYGADGKLMSKGMKIRTSELPSAVSDAVKTGYAGRNIDEVYRMDKDGTAYYLVKLSGDPETKVKYTADGQVVKEKKDK